MRGVIEVSDFDDERWNEPAVRELRTRIRVEHAPELDARYPDVDSSEIVAESNDGTVLRRRLDAPPGGPDNPMTPNRNPRTSSNGLAARALPDVRVLQLRRASRRSTARQRCARSDRCCRGA